MIEAERLSKREYAMSIYRPADIPRIIASRNKSSTAISAAKMIREIPSINMNAFETINVMIMIVIVYDMKRAGLNTSRFWKHLNISLKNAFSMTFTIPKKFYYFELSEKVIHSGQQNGRE